MKKIWYQFVIMIRSRYWFNYWWASYCGIHYYYNHGCEMCKAGNWTNDNSRKNFGTLRDPKNNTQKLFNVNKK